MTADPVFQVGDVLEVISNGGKNTPRIGVVHRIVWHHKENQFFYFIQAGGKKRSKRYAAEDLRHIASRRPVDATQ